MGHGPIEIDLIGNLDFGQDLLRLGAFLARENGIDFYRSVRAIFDVSMETSCGDLPAAAIERGLVMAESSSDVTKDGWAI